MEQKENVFRIFIDFLQFDSKWIGTACISPSRAFGPAVVVGGVAWNRHWLLWLADLSGGVLGSAYYM